MDMELNAVEIRVLGCLIEKEIATPEYYPLTLNALTNACNQKSNRQPVVELDHASVLDALDSLRMTHQLAVEVNSSDSRVPKYRHTFRETFNFSPAKVAVLCELFLRGPQTPGDMRAHASRLSPIEHRDEAEEILRGLERHSSGPYVVQLTQEPGRREKRWAHLFCGEENLEAAQAPSLTPPISEEVIKRIETLEQQMQKLEQMIHEITQD